ncbi:Aste57867_23198 [Aphanomyces stellatus]|uniref:Aste57867_23198 protein n=1 Tax=Aphanomyces stellatus TaxID=120398 RepID=A0A485LP00_9STRA|nr:hypothetical protein As57867_023127 [Aphanomyces stellatus]VFT99845.1 Aste57867_23198 [Aphanomyces stellatus]
MKSQANNIEMMETPGIFRRILNSPHLPMFVCNIALPLLIFNIAKEYTSQIVAVFLSGIPPIVKTLVQVFLFGQMDVISIIQILSTAFSVAIMLFTTDAKVLLVKDSLTTVTMATLHFLSLSCFDEDIFFTFRRHFTTKSREDMDAAYAKPHVRQVSRTLTVVWGIVMLVEAAARIGLILALSVETIVYVSPFLPMLFFWPLGYWTFKYIQTHETDDGPVHEPLLATAKELEKQIDSVA